MNLKKLGELKELSKLAGYFGGIPSFFDNFKEMEDIVLGYPKLKARIEARPDEKHKALNNLKEIRAEVSIPFLKAFENF